MSLARRFDVLDAQRSLSRRLQAHFQMVVGGNLLNLDSPSKKKNCVMPGGMAARIKSRHFPGSAPTRFPSRTTTNRSVRSRGFGSFFTGRP